MVEADSFGGRPDVPLADSRGPVPPGRKCLRKRCSRQMRAPVSFGKLRLDDRPSFTARVDIVVFQVSITTATVLAGQYPGAGGHADRVARDGDLETDPIGREVVYVWRADHVVAIAADFEGPKLIADAEDYIGFLYV